MSASPTMLENLHRALGELLAEDKRVLLLGEDIVDPYGGAFKVTKGFSSRFPGRVYPTPISEAAIVGVSVGLALRGLRPVAEIMFGDFLTLAADQLINHAAKYRWMYNDAVRVPLVVRTPMGARRGYGPTHSQTIEKHLLGAPGLWVVAAAPVGDPGLLLRQAVLEIDDPVLFIENKVAYNQQILTAPEGWTEIRIADSLAPFPTTHFRRTDGTDAMLLCYGGMAQIAFEAAQELFSREGLRVDVSVFSQLSPFPHAHLPRLFEHGLPGALVYAEEAWTEAGWSAETLASVEQYRAETGAPPIHHHRVGAAPTPIPCDRTQEADALPQVADLVDAVLSCF